MRYDKIIYFVKQSKKKYDPDAGEWISGQQVRTKRFARVIRMPAERQQVVFGDVKVGRTIVHLQREYKTPFDFIEINGKRCFLDKEHCPVNNQCLVVTEDGGN